MWEEPSSKTQQCINWRICREFQEVSGLIQIRNLMMDISRLSMTMLLLPATAFNDAVRSYLQHESWPCRATLRKEFKQRCQRLTQLLSSFQHLSYEKKTRLRLLIYTCTDFLPRFVINFPICSPLKTSTFPLDFSCFLMGTASIVWRSLLLLLFIVCWNCVYLRLI